MIKQIYSANLRIGMYVSKLDRPWTETPFLFQGFSINTQEDIDTLRKYTRFVYIDTEKDTSIEKRIPTRTVFNCDSKNFLPKRSKTYKTKTSVEKEIKVAKDCYKHLVHSFHAISQQLINRVKLDINQLEYAVKAMVNSISRCPDAFMLLSQLRLVDHYYFNRAISCSVLAVTFARYLGLSANELKDLGLGVLLSDIGLINLPREIVTCTTTLNGDQFEIYKTHVNHSVNILRENNIKNREIVKIAQFHHELHNGSGYPSGIIGLQIPPLARIAGLIDYYMELTMPYKKENTLANPEAIQLLNNTRDIKFQRELVDEFVRSLGVFSSGSIIEISSGEIGFVIAQNSSKKLRPKIMLVLDKQKQSLGHMPIIDLSCEETDSNNNFLKITKTHQPQAFGLNLSDYIQL